MLEKVFQHTTGPESPRESVDSILGPIPFLTGHGIRHVERAAEVFKGLPAVDVSPHRVVRELTGLRPYRPSGYRIATQMLDGKLVVHNYGHGGAGITLSWGTAIVATGMIEKPGGTEIAVIGSGVIGLTTAILLQRRGYRVRIYTKALPLNTTSNVAAAFWAPVSIYRDANVDSTFKQQFKKASDESHRIFRSLEGEKYGVSWIRTFIMTGDAGEVNDKLLSRQSIEEVRSLMISPPVYLNALAEEFRRAGGVMVITEISSLRDLASLSEDVVMNCTGLGSYTLFGDTELIPVKGQLIILQPQPEIDYSYILDSKDSLYYMFPRKDGIILGGTMEHGNWSCDPDPKVSTHILDGHKAIASGMK